MIAEMAHGLHVIDLDYSRISIFLHTSCLHYILSGRRSPLAHRNMTEKLYYYIIHILNAQSLSVWIRFFFHGMAADSFSLSNYEESCG